VKSIKEKKQEEQEITLLQSKASINSPNFAILDKLKTEMRKLKEFKVRSAMCIVLLLGGFTLID
jgi:microprocessor complex subunit DGCR8